jgi:hypothetical protein
MHCPVWRQRLAGRGQQHGVTLLKSYTSQALHISSVTLLKRYTSQALHISSIVGVAASLKRLQSWLLLGTGCVSSATAYALYPSFGAAPVALFVGFKSCRKVANAWRVPSSWQVDQQAWQLRRKANYAIQYLSCASESSFPELLCRQVDQQLRQPGRYV